MLSLTIRYIFAESRIREALITFTIILTVRDLTVLTEYGKEMMPNPIVEQSKVWIIPNIP